MPVHVPGVDNDVVETVLGPFSVEGPSAPPTYAAKLERGDFS